jgi:protein-S-isoprenylcysteine O-methyltransferase Ste14
MSAQAKAIIQVVVIGAILAYAVWSRTSTLGPMTPVRTVGVALMIGGFIGWAAARLQLGRSFSIRAKATELVTAGIYSKIRNPVYVFGTIIFVGFMLWFRKPMWLLFLVIIIPVQIVRAGNEARVLEAKFGDGYRAYRAKTWF